MYQNNVIIIPDRAMLAPQSSNRQHLELSSTRNHLLSNVVSNSHLQQQLENVEEEPVAGGRAGAIISFKFQDDSVRVLSYTQLQHVRVSEIKEVHFRRERQRTREIRFFHKGRELQAEATLEQQSVRANDVILAVL